MQTSLKPRPCKNTMTSIKQRVLLLLLMGLCPGWSQSSADALPETMELVYEVKFGVLTLGSLSSKLTKQSTHYQVTKETQAQGMAAVFLGGTVREMCEFSIDDNVIKPAKYRIVREGKDTFDHSVSIDTEKRQVSFNNGTDVIISEGYIVDNCSAPFAYIIGGAEIVKHKALHIVGGRKVRKFENSVVEEQQVSSPLGKFDAIKIEQVRIDRPDRKLTIWLVPNRGNLPIKIVEQRKSRPNTTMLLTSVEGL